MGKENKVWELDTDYVSHNKFKKFSRSHKAEFDSLFVNLDRVKTFLQNGLNVGSFKLGFFRSEGGGIYRISQSAVEDSHESRLYIHIYTKGRTIYILGIGDKSDQQSDITAAKKAAKRIAKATR